MTSTLLIATRSLGATGIQVTPVGLGVMELSGGGGLVGFAFPRIAQTEKNAIIQTALDGGINWFDTAELYGSGVSEQSLAAGLKAAGKTDDEVVIATKWWPLLRTAANIPRTIDNRLQYLGGFSVSNYMVHQPISFSSPEAEMDAMADLVEAGKIRSVGVSNFNPQRMQRAFTRLQQRGLPLAVNQVHYSLLNRKIETNGILKTAKELGVSIIAYTPLERGLLSGKYHKEPSLLQKLPRWRRGLFTNQIEHSRPVVALLENIAATHNVTLAQVAINWLIHFNGETVVTIPGATKVYQAAEAAGAMHFKLSEEELVRLDEVSRGFR